MHALSHRWWQRHDRQRRRQELRSRRRYIHGHRHRSPIRLAASSSEAPRRLARCPDADGSESCGGRHAEESWGSVNRSRRPSISKGKCPSTRPAHPECSAKSSRRARGRGNHGLGYGFSFDANADSDEDGPQISKRNDMSNINLHVTTSVIRTHKSDMTTEI